MSVDEGMIDTLGDFDGSMTIKRKPKGKGVLNYMGAVMLSGSNMPYVLFMRPNIPTRGKTHYSHKRVIQVFADMIQQEKSEKNFPQKIVMVMDGLFCYPEIISGYLAQRGILASFGMQEKLFLDVMKDK